MWSHLWEAAVLRAPPLRGPVPPGRVLIHLPSDFREELRLRQDAEVGALRRAIQVGFRPRSTSHLVACTAALFRMTIIYACCIGQSCDGRLDVGHFVGRCERRCTGMRACGRHACKKRCCDGNHPPCDQVPITQLLLEFDDNHDNNHPIWFYAGVACNAQQNCRAATI